MWFKFKETKRPPKKKHMPKREVTPKMCGKIQYFNNIVSHVIFFHPSLKGKDLLDIIPKG